MTSFSYFTIYFAGTIVVLLHLQLLNIGWVLLEEGRLLRGSIAASSCASFCIWYFGFSKGFMLWLLV